MKRSVENDKKRRSCFVRWEWMRMVLKSVSQNQELESITRLRAVLMLSVMPRDSSLIRIKRRCVLTGRGRFILGRYNMSRLIFSSLAKKAFLPGLRKASW